MRKPTHPMPKLGPYASDKDKWTEPFRNIDHVEITPFEVLFEKMHKCSSVWLKSSTVKGWSYNTGMLNM